MAYQVQGEVVDGRILDEPTVCCPWADPVLVEGVLAGSARHEDLSEYSLNGTCVEMSVSREKSQQQQQKAAAADPCP